MTPEAIDQVWLRLKAGQAAKPTARELGPCISPFREYMILGGRVVSGAGGLAAREASGVVSGCGTLPPRHGVVLATLRDVDVGGGVGTG